MRYYVIADIHGRYDLLIRAEEAICKDAEECSEFKTIFLGDYIDRGPQSKEVIEYLGDICDDKDVFCLQGNHEAMAVETMVVPLAPDWWFGNGGNVTIQSYAGSMFQDAYTSLGWMNKDHIKWMAGLPLYHETKNHIFVHAGIPYPDKPMSEQDPDNMQWMLYKNDDPGWWMNKHVVHGHHQFADGPHEWEGRTDLDCHAYHTGRLVIGVFDDNHIKAVKYLEVLGDDYGSKGRKDFGERLLQST